MLKKLFTRFTKDSNYMIIGSAILALIVASLALILPTSWNMPPIVLLLLIALLIASIRLTFMVSDE